jgi:ADP-ribose pyrophosphatase YjhB (NUDIX family)
MTKEIKFAPREIFEQMLEYMVIPTFDLVIEYGQKGVVIVRRKIAPYKDVWALPGLRMYKGEDIEDTLSRIALQELGLEINPKERTFIGQYVGVFRTEHERQDLSTGYIIRVSDEREIKLNEEHFYNYQITTSIPENVGAMYKYYLQQYFSNIRPTRVWE